MSIAGVDPGLRGGLVLIGDDRTEACLMPLTGKEVDGAAVGRWLLDAEPDLVVLEKVGSRPGQGVRSTFSFGQSYGKVMGVLESMNIPYRLVTPQAWKRKVLAGTAKDKEAAIQFVRRAYPTINLTPGRCRTPQDGIADAACLAVYGREHLGLDR